MTPTEVIDRYCAVWNEPDRARAATMLAEVWAPGATYTDPTVHAAGAEALLAHIATVRARRPGAKVLRTSEVDVHHGAARFAWHVLEANGNALPEGIDIAYFSADGRKIERILGFFGPLRREAGAAAPGWLPREQFLEVVARTPLVSMDLVLRDPRGRILLGRRRNEPAKDFWFAPGGRILKDESLEEAFRRLCEAELGQPRAYAEARSLGQFSHRYATNVYGVEGVGTHYVVLAVELDAAADFIPAPQAQHAEYRWFAREEAAGPEVHEYVRPYFR